MAKWRFETLYVCISQLLPRAEFCMNVLEANLFGKPKNKEEFSEVIFCLSTFASSALCNLTFLGHHIGRTVFKCFNIKKSCHAMKRGFIGFREQQFIESWQKIYLSKLLGALASLRYAI